MNRRRFLFAVAATGAAVLAFVPRPATAQSRNAAVAAWRGRIGAILARGGLPIIDMQATYQADTNVARIIEFMDRLDVALIAFAPANAPNSQPSLALHGRYPDRFIPTTNSGEFPRWWNNPAAFLSGVNSDLESGQYFLMGEYEFRHYPSPEQVEAGQSQRDITIALDGPAGHDLFQLGEDSGVPFQIHYDVEDRLLPALEAMLTRYPKAKVIWCHLGMVRYPDRAKLYGPAYVRGLIERFPGLYFDLAVPGPNSIYRPSGARDSTIYRDGQLDPAWRDLLEAHADRFVVGSDYRLPVEARYGDTIERVRSLILAALSEPARQAIAYGNAWRLTTGSTWTA